ncbi:MAG: hypothetical protein ACRDJT_06545 [Actinomycetota bacterium]
MHEGTDTRRNNRTGPSMGDRIIRFGAIAAAIVTILGLARLVWPDPTPRLAGELADVSIVTRMTLAEFADRQKLGANETVLDIGFATTGESSRSLRLAGSLHTQETPSPTPTPEPSPSPSPSPTETTEPDLNCPLCSEQVAFEFQQVQEQLSTRSLPHKCRYTNNGRMRCDDRDVMEIIMPPEDVTTQNGVAFTRSEDLLKILDGTRSRVVSGDVTEPLGVAISFDLTLEGLLNRKIDVRWSLFSAGRATMVPQDWLINRRALVAIPEATFDRASGEFWIPLPKKRGPYFVRVSAWDQNDRLDFSDSGPFR